MIIDLKYNPYKRETKILIDGKAISSDDKLKEIETGTLQNWIKKFKNIIYEYDFKNLNIKFTGRSIDFKDLESEFINDKKIHLEHFEITSTEERMERLKNIFRKIQEGPYEELKKEKVIQNFEKVFSQEFEIAVVATMSSGKSTLLNSFLGDNIIPAKNQACTAKITRIENSKEDNYSAEVFDEKGNKIGNFNDITGNDLENFNSNENIELIKLKGNIKNINSSEVKLVLIDTPGPNNSMNLKHKELTFKLLKEEYKPLLLYILNYQQLSINDDKLFLEEIAKEMEKADLQSKERFIFVLNKFDARFEDEKDDDMNDVIKKVKEYLKAFNIHNPIIIPTAAQTALLARIDSNKLNDRSLRNRNRVIENIIDVYKDQFNINDYLLVSNNIKNALHINLKKAEDETNDKKLAEILSGVPALEMYIEEYLEKYAIPEKIIKAGESFSNFLKREELLNKISKVIEGDKSKKEELQIMIENLANNKKKVIPEIEKELTRKIEEIKKNLSSITRKQEAKVERIRESIAKELNATRKIRDKNEANKKIANFIKKLQNEYLIIKSDIDQDIKSIVAAEVKGLLEFYSNELKKLKIESKHREIAELIKNILDLSIKNEINFDRNEINKILEKSYR